MCAAHPHCMTSQLSRRWLVGGTALTAALAACAVTDGEEGASSAESALAEPSVGTGRFAIPAGGGLVPPSTVGQPYGTNVRGLLTFRGNPTRTFYGHGRVPSHPHVLWRFPENGSLCGESTVGNETKTWCGTGWTGQPSMFDREGKTWVVFGAYDKNIHFLDAANGARLREDFATGDIIKGSVTIDADGYPIVYSGSRDNKYRAIAFDVNPPRELFALRHTQVPEPMWNSDWDGSGLVLRDHVFIGGENSWFHVAKLGRGYGADGRVKLDAPALRFAVPAYDRRVVEEELSSRNREHSIEGSPVVIGNTVFFSTSGGLVQGWDVSGVFEGRAPTRTFRMWTGDDTDATLVADEQGMLYVAQEYERGNARSRECGQILKIDPRKAGGEATSVSCDPSDPSSPVVWRYHDTPHANPSGVWGSPALYRDILVVPTHRGDLIGLDRNTGAVRWKKDLGDHLWSSPVIVDGTLIQGTCATGELVAYDVRNTTQDPPELWRLRLDGGCIESTPAVFDGRIIVGTRGGKVYAIGD